ncbi:MAG: M20/M25/M40 family metallo-hydrolase [Anaerolineales bacterium]|nr:M20/M25/M40 family metallo-hydrolase [Anaerolineales bacterium]MCW5854916.1 M20/M25/M40 family metallo-hydrolase [Anaerolineales bacterium]
MSDYNAIDDYIERNLDASLDELAKLCAVPSIAAQNLNLDECAELVAQMLQARGFQTEIMPSGGAPVVYAERKGKTDKTLLFYNHYDVQPAEPLELWDSPPFEATRRDGKVYARGVSDDKGHFVSRLFALDALLAQTDELPCNIKFVVEGEEEISSVHLPGFIEQHADKLAADACIWEFGYVDPDDKPMQILGMRGICYVQLEVELLSQDVHSGLGGSIFPNAAWRLVWALSTLKDQDERILIPGHYDNVLPPTELDRQLAAARPYLGDEYRQRYGVKEFLRGTNSQPELLLQETMEPTCTICGLTAGYQGEGSKTVLPAKASAKVDFRLVPNQTPEEVLKNLRAHLDAQGFEDVKINYLGGEAPGRVDPRDPFIQLVANAAEGVYGWPQQIVPMSGASGPNHAFIHHLKLPVAAAGMGYPGGQVHAPNENIREDLYLKTTKHVARVVQQFAQS